MGSLPQDTIARESVELDRTLWADRAGYFFRTLVPRISKSAVRADDACLQCQIDVFGKDNVGKLCGSLSPAGNFAALIYAESLPDRLPILAYLNEILSFYEAFEEQFSQMTGSKMDTMVPKAPGFDNPVWQANIQKVLPKCMMTLAGADPVLGPQCIQTMKELTESPYLGPRVATFTSMEEYVEARIPDIAWPSVFACAAFGAGVHLTKEQTSALDDVFRPLWEHSCYAYDFHTWDKELKSKAKRDPDSPIVNGIPVLQRLHGLSVDDAKAWLASKCFELEAEYLKRKEDYFKQNPKDLSSAELQQWFHCQEAIATGFALWCSCTYRHYPPYAVGYHRLYEQRQAEGATYFDNSEQSKDLLTGVWEVKLSK